MTVLSAQSIQRRLRPSAVPAFVLEIDPFVAEAKQYLGKSYGLTAAGYDIRLGKLRHPKRHGEIVQSCWLLPGKFMLAASLERMRIPVDIQAVVHDKSSWARKGLALQNTVLEPGWEGYITLELSNHGHNAIEIKTGMPIAQVVFHELDSPTNRPYSGKYQHQSDTPTYAIDAEDTEEEVTDESEGA